MKNCKTCKWWGNVDEDFDHGQLAGGDEHKPCGNKYISDSYSSDLTTGSIHGLNSNEPVSTGPYFGCTHHEYK